MVISVPVMLVAIGDHSLDPLFHRGCKMGMFYHSFHFNN